MDKMNLIGKCKIFKNQYGYSASESEKDRNGNYINYYIPVNFPKTMAILPDDKETIEIIKGFTKHYKKTIDNKDYTLTTYMILEWKSLGVEKPAIEVKEDKEDPYADFAQEVEITEEMLPF